MVEEAARASPDTRVVEMEAARVARRAAAALKRDQELARRDAANVHVPTWMGQHGEAGRFGGAANSQILSALRNRGVAANAASSNSHALLEVQEEGTSRLCARNGRTPTCVSRADCATCSRAGPPSQSILAELGHEAHAVMEPELFRKLLREMADKADKLWTLKPDYA